LGGAGWGSGGARRSSASRFAPFRVGEVGLGALVFVCLFSLGAFVFALVLFPFPGAAGWPPPPHPGHPARATPWSRARRRPTPRATRLRSVPPAARGTRRGATKAERAGTLSRTRPPATLRARLADLQVLHRGRIDPNRDRIATSQLVRRRDDVDANRRDAMTDLSGERLGGPCRDGRIDAVLDEQAFVHASG